MIMKKLIILIVLLPILLSQCSNKEPVVTDCGCSSSKTIKSFEDINATVVINDPSTNEKAIELSKNDLDSNAEYFATLIPCDTNLLKSSDYQEGTIIKISGLIKPICTRPEIKIGASPVKITKINIVKNK